MSHQVPNSADSQQVIVTKQYLEQLTNENMQLKSQTYELNNELLRLNNMINILNNRITSLNKQIETQQSLISQTEQNMWKLHNLELSNRSLNSSNQLLSAQNQALMLSNAKLELQIKKGLEKHHVSANQEERLKSIQAPYFNYGLISCDKCKLPSTTIELQPASAEEYRSQHITELNNLPNHSNAWTEIEWLDYIISKLEEYNFMFSKRLIYAFHTCLKIAEWSPLTVLAGVSGTGKSELPRLYSLFGGLNFINLPVQPSWDSQEAMLGYYNTLDSKFDAQPILRMLYQSQTAASNKYPEGTQDAMHLVLLDEMNLAHVELYFADFLSKFEERRGRSDDNLPELEVKLGAGVPPYKLPLGRNVMWVGTMNQDETTKSLSDKVIDRGMVIHFPRPNVFQSRKKIKALPPRPLFNMPFEFWKSHFVTTSNNIPDDIIKGYKEDIETINHHLGLVGRALGHRVWQSIEAYLFNYPTVKEILSGTSSDKLNAEQTEKLKKEVHKAFEDQLVQKVMPKLRGIETRGKAKSSCLDPIESLLSQHNFSIGEDFKLACTLGYGQFMWNSANYLNIEDQAIDAPSTPAPQSQTNTAAEQKPDPDDAGLDAPATTDSAADNLDSDSD